MFLVKISCFPVNGRRAGMEHSSSRVEKSHPAEQIGSRGSGNASVRQVSGDAAWKVRHWQWWIASNAFPHRTRKSGWMFWPLDLREVGEVFLHGEVVHLPPKAGFRILSALGAWQNLFITHSQQKMCCLLPLDVYPYLQTQPRHKTPSACLFMSVYTNREFCCYLLLLPIQCCEYLKMWYGRRFRWYCISNNILLWPCSQIQQHK